MKNLRKYQKNLTNIIRNAGTTERRNKSKKKQEIPEIRTDLYEILKE